MAGVTIRVEFDDAEVRRALDRLVFPARAGMNRRMRQRREPL